MKNTPLNRDPEEIRAFIDRGRRSSAESLRRRPGKRAGISPASDAQREAVAELRCLGCGKLQSKYLAIDPAHLWPRGRGGCDSRLCVGPLCRRKDGSGCHRDFDEGRLDLLRVLVADWDRWRRHVQHALQHARPVELLERLSGARIEWSDR